MPMLDPNATVGAFVTERPGRSRVFEEFGIDYCCGGKTSLSAACEQAGIEVDQVLAAITDADASTGPDDIDWSQRSALDLVGNIVETHHAYLVAELPRLEGLTRKIARVHGDNHPELRTVADVYAALQEELRSHMMKEEQILFPMVEELTSAQVRPRFHCGSVNNPMGVMEIEHDNAGGALVKLRELTSDYSPPEDACNTYRAALDGLAALERDLHMHIHKENNILFPMVSAMEASLPARA
ncbi:iron-sulfur cluster repair di-iron protein [Candidatus Poribacteria bacterium]|nr:iron-sulfur cluster repair di-iron protein [Candidatus Poribacteria bacterium]